MTDKIDNKSCQTVHITFILEDGSEKTGSFTGPSIVENKGQQLRVRNLQITEPYQLPKNCYFGTINDDE